MIAGRLPQRTYVAITGYVLDLAEFGRMDSCDEMDSPLDVQVATPIPIWRRLQ